jgi:hypothetical protein
MGAIKSAAEVGIAGHVVTGLPILFDVMRGLGDEKINPADNRIKGHKGTRATVSVALPVEFESGLSLTAASMLTWAIKNTLNVILV